MDDLLDAGRHRLGGVQRDHVLDVLREAFLHPLHRAADVLRDLQAVGIGQLVDRQHGGRLGIEGTDLVVGLGAQFDAGHVAQQHLRAVGVRAHHHLAELFRRLQAAAGLHGIGELGAGRRRRAAELAGRGQHVLLLHGVDDVRHGEAQPAELVRLDPDAHGVVGTTEDGDLADALDARDLVEHVDRHVVGEEVRVEGAVGRTQGHQHQRESQRLLDLDPLALDLLR